MSPVRRILGAVTGAILIPLAALAAEPLSVELLPGHPIHRQIEREAGVAMALAVAADRAHAAELSALCDELRVRAGLALEAAPGRHLEVVFVVPRHGMAIEGLYLSGPEDVADSRLVRGEAIARAELDGVVGRAGLPPAVLDETGVEHEISCVPGEGVWRLVWQDVQPIAAETAQAVIERGRERFVAIHRSVVEHTLRTPSLIVAKPRRGRPAEGG